MLDPNASQRPVPVQCPEGLEPTLHPPTPTACASAWLSLRSPNCYLVHYLLSAVCCELQATLRYTTTSTTYSTKIWRSRTLFLILILVLICSIFTLSILYSTLLYPNTTPFLLPPKSFSPIAHHSFFPFSRRSLPIEARIVVVSLARRQYQIARPSLRLSALSNLDTGLVRRYLLIA